MLKIKVSNFLFLKHTQIFSNSICNTECIIFTVARTVVLVETELRQQKTSAIFTCQSTVRVTSVPLLVKITGMYSCVLIL